MMFLVECGEELVFSLDFWMFLIHVAETNIKLGRFKNACLMLCGFAYRVSEYLSNISQLLLVFIRASP